MPAPTHARRVVAGGLVAAVAYGMLAGPGGAQSGGTSDTLGRSTVEQTILGGDRTGDAFAFLTPGPGETYMVREEGLGTAQQGRETRRRSLAYFAQLTDFQLSDEESPARVEFLDASADEPLNSPFGAAWRPQEALVAHMTEESIRQVNAFADASPVAQRQGARAKLGFAITTGDSADSQQRNETEAVVNLLDGNRVVTNSGSANPADYAQCPPGTPGPEEGARYTGVQDYGDGLGGTAFWDPDQPVGQFAGFPLYTGLMDRAQESFQATGLRVPSYVTFGNHDALAQGNQATNRAFEDVATGCIKVFAPVPGLDPLSAAAAGPILLSSVPPAAGLVPPDPARQYVSKKQYKELHRTERQPDAHGLGLIDPAEEEASAGAAGYYAFAPAPGFRFIGLDTVSEGGVAGPSANGNIDDPQFRWLERELAAAQKADELVVLFGHHPIRSLTSPIADEMAPPCTVPDEHDHDVNPGCDLDPRESTPIHNGDDLEALLLANDNVIALVSGHTHENHIEGVKRQGGGGFWAIETAAEIDFPHQNRLLEVMDNRDGTLSIFGTVLDHAGPIEAPPAGDASGFSVAELASVGRLIGYNDPQSAKTSDTGEVGSGGLGRVRDRNVELLLRDPRAETTRVTPKPDKKPKPDKTSGKKTVSDDDATEEAPSSPPAAARESGSLPFTGLPLVGIVAAGFALLASGLALRRRRAGS
jgi:metallophosphoesterase (TIGR03767 family)